jgi:hypothetical protein
MFAEGFSMLSRSTVKLHSQLYHREMPLPHLATAGQYFFPISYSGNNQA